MTRTPLAACRIARRTRNAPNGWLAPGVSRLRYLEDYPPQKQFSSGQATPQGHILHQSQTPAPHRGRHISATPGHLRLTPPGSPAAMICPLRLIARAEAPSSAPPGSDDGPSHDAPTKPPRRHVATSPKSRSCCSGVREAENFFFPSSSSSSFLLPPPPFSSLLSSPTAAPAGGRPAEPAPRRSRQTHPGSGTDQSGSQGGGSHRAVGSRSCEARARAPSP